MLSSCSIRELCKLKKIDFTCVVYSCNVNLLYTCDHSLKSICLNPSDFTTSQDVSTLIDTQESAIMISSRKCTYKNNYTIAWTKGDKFQLWIVDTLRKSLYSVQRPNLRTFKLDEIVDGFCKIDPEHQIIVLISKNLRELWCWRSLNLAEANRIIGEWTNKKLFPTIESLDYVLTNDCQMFNSHMLGSCFMYALLTIRENLVIFSLFILEVATNWQVLQQTSSEVGVLNIQEFGVEHEIRQAHLIIGRNTMSNGVAAINNQLWYFDTRKYQTLDSSAISFSDDILDIAWANEKTCVVLMENGCLHILHCNQPNNAQLNNYELSVANVISGNCKRSSKMEISLLDSKIFTQKDEKSNDKLQLVLLADVGSKEYYVFELSTDLPKSHNPIDESMPTYRYNMTGPPPIERVWQRMKNRISYPQTTIEDELSVIFEDETLNHTQSIVQLLEITRIAIAQSHIQFHTLFFTLISILHQQIIYMELKGNIVHSGYLSKDHERICMGVLLRLFMPLSTNLQEWVISKILQAPAFTSKDARDTYFKDKLILLQNYSIYDEAVSSKKGMKYIEKSGKLFCQTYVPEILKLLDNIVMNHINDISIAANFCHYLKIGRLDIVLDLVGASIIKTDQSRLAIDHFILIMFQYSVVSDELGLFRVTIDIFNLVCASMCGKISPVQLTTAQMMSMIPTAHSCHSGLKSVVSCAKYSSIRWNLKTVLEYIMTGDRNSKLKLLFSHILLSSSGYRSEYLKSIFPYVEASNFRSMDIHLYVCHIYLQAIKEIFNKRISQENRIIQALSNDIKVRETEDRFQHLKNLFLSRLIGSSNLSLDKEIDLEWRNLVYLVRLIIWHMHAWVRNMYGCGDTTSANNTFTKRLLEETFLVAFFSAPDSKYEEYLELLSSILAVRDSDGFQQQKFKSNYSTTGVHDMQLWHPIHVLLRQTGLLIWGFWLQEVSYFCLDEFTQLKSENIEVLEKETLGKLAISCALHLNTWRILIAPSAFSRNTSSQHSWEVILSLQAQLITESLALNNPSIQEKVKFALILRFPFNECVHYPQRSRKVWVKLLEKVKVSNNKSARQVKELEQYIYQKLYKIFFGTVHLSKAQDMNKSQIFDSEFSALLQCCCDLNFQKLIWQVFGFNFQSCVRHSLIVCNDSQQTKPIVKVLTHPTQREQMMKEFRLQKELLAQKIAMLSSLTPNKKTIDSQHKPLNSTLEQTDSIIGTKRLSQPWTSFRNPELPIRNEEKTKGSTCTVRRSSSPKVLKLLQIQPTPQVNCASGELHNNDTAKKNSPRKWSQQDLIYPTKETRVFALRYNVDKTEKRKIFELDIQFETPSDFDNHVENLAPSASSDRPQTLSNTAITDVNTSDETSKLQNDKIELDSVTKSSLDIKDIFPCTQDSLEKLTDERTKQTQTSWNAGSNDSALHTSSITCQNIEISIDDTKETKDAAIQISSKTNESGILKIDQNNTTMQRKDTGIPLSISLLTKQRHSLTTSQTLKDIKNDLNRMTEKLKELETTATDIENDFQKSYIDLRQLESQRERRIGTQVTNERAELVKQKQITTSITDCQQEYTGALGRKALSDLQTAKELVTQINKLTGQNNKI